MIDWLIQIRETKFNLECFFTKLFQEVILFSPHSLEPLIEELVAINFKPKEVYLSPEIYISFRYYLTQGSETLLTYEQSLRGEQCNHQGITFYSIPHLTNVVFSEYIYNPEDEKDIPPIRLIR